MRKTETVVIPEDPKNRDHGKVFVITEPSSYECEMIALRYFTATSHKEDDEKKKAGMAGVAAVFDTSNPDIQNLLSQLMSCVKYQHAPGHPLQTIKEGDECQIEEVSTRMQLKMTAFELITGFSMVGDLQTIAQEETQKSPA